MAGKKVCWLTGLSLPSLEVDTKCKAFSVATQCDAIPIVASSPHVSLSLLALSPSPGGQQLCNSIYSF